VAKKEKDYYTFCDARMMEVAKKAYVVEFLENKKNGKLFKNLELLAYDIFSTLSKFDTNYDLERLAETMAFTLRKSRNDELKQNFVGHCLDKNARCNAEQGLEAMGYVLIGIIKESEKFIKS